MITNLPVHNLTDLLFDPDALHSLGLGLNFIPTPSRTSPSKVLPSFDIFARRFKLFCFFSHDEDDPGPNRKIYLPSSWTPPDEKLDPAALDYLEKTQKLLEDSLHDASEHPTKHPYNLSKERKAKLYELFQRPDIKICKADKDGSPVICYTSKYDEELLKQFPIATFHTLPLQAAKRRIKSAYTEICELALQITGEDTQCNLFRFLTEFATPETNTFGEAYLLWKVHKNPVVGRMIVPHLSSVTTALSRWVDVTLQSVVLSCDTHLKDSLSFIRDME